MNLEKCELKVLIKKMIDTMCSDLEGVKSETVMTGDVAGFEQPIGTPVKRKLKDLEDDNEE